MTGPTYDEFAFFAENAEEAGLPWNGPPLVTRRAVDVGGGRNVRALVWGDGPPEMVLLHGSAQNAHTWDTVALALDRPLVAIDLPGHGHSDWRDDLDYRPPVIAADVAAAIEELAPDAETLVGMSMGGLTAVALARQRPDLVRRLAIVDITPGTNRQKAAAIFAFVSGPERFASFDEILERTVAHNPTRSPSSLRRGVLHNARPDGDDGGWTWRYDRRRNDAMAFDVSTLWDDVSALTMPLMLIRGGASPVVDDDDVVEWMRRQPATRVEVVDGAGHSIQGDRPLELAALIDDFVFA